MDPDWNHYKNRQPGNRGDGMSHSNFRNKIEQLLSSADIKKEYVEIFYRMCKY